MSSIHDRPPLEAMVSRARQPMTVRNAARSEAARLARRVIDLEGVALNAGASDAVRELAADWSKRMMMRRAFILNADRRGRRPGS